MNERIKELFEQAGTDVSGKWMGIDNAEKFAELIVLECADFLKDKLDDHFAAEQLEEYFGVEE
jgi:hypothetical protein